MPSEKEKPHVWITQIPHRHVGNDWIPAFDMAPAHKWGIVKVIAPHSPTFLDTVELVKKLRTAMEDYNYERGDYLIMTGDPAVISIASAILGDFTSRYRILKWHMSSNNYIPVEVNLEP